MRGRILVASASAVVVFLVTGCAGPGAAPVGSVTSAPSPSATADAPQLPDPIPTPWVGAAPGELSTEVVEALLALRETWPQRYPENYAGVATGSPDSADVLVVYLADSTEALESAIRAETRLPVEKIRFERAYQSLRDAQRIDREIAAAVPALLAEGIELNTYGVGVDGVEDIGMDHPTDEQVAHLFTIFGPYLRIDPAVGPARLL